MDEIANVQTLPQLPTLQVSRVPLWRHALYQKRIPLERVYRQQSRGSLDVTGSGPEA